MKHLNQIKEWLMPAILVLSISCVSAQTIQNQKMIRPRKQATLPEGHIYLPHEKLSIVKDIWNGQRRIHFEISNPYIRERELHVFLKLGAEELSELITGTYELFFTGSALALTNRSTGKKVLFVTNHDSDGPNMHIKHGNVDKLVDAIRIAAYFKTCHQP